MDVQNNSSDIVIKQSYDIQLLEFEKGVLGFLASYGLPTESILVSVDERKRVLQNFDAVMSLLSDDKKQKSLYISKFIAATASGLFDAALNFLWNETISELRLRVAHYDLSYFYEIAVPSTDRRKNLNNADDLVKIDDSELIYGAKEIGLLSDLGFRHLDYIRFMRNWVSAAHPNQNEVTGLQLISWLETCIKEVVLLPISPVVGDINRLLGNIKAHSISDDEARDVGAFFLELTQDQVNNLASGFFGLYTRPDTTPTTRQNIHRLLPLLWDRVDEQTRELFGVKFGKFVADNDQDKSKLARQFLELVSALPYMPDVLRAAEIETALQNLLSAHRNMNNFYNEPPFARQLQRIVGQVGNVPPQIYKKYVLGLVEVFLTNGNGIAWNADPIYRSLIELFDYKQAFIAILSFTDGNIASTLQFTLCQEQYLKLLDILKTKISAPALKELIEEIENYKGSLELLKKDFGFKRKIANLSKILNVNINF